MGGIGAFGITRAVSRVNTNMIHNTYVNREVVRNATGTRASFNGPGGVQAKPTAREQAAAKAAHVAPTSAQRSRLAAARNDPAFRARNNNGKPKAATVKTFDRRHQPKVDRDGGGGKYGTSGREEWRGRPGSAPKRRRLRPGKLGPKNELGQQNKLGQGRQMSG